MSQRAADLRLPRRRSFIPWTRTETGTLRKLFERGLSDAEIADKLGNRTIEAVKRQRASMGMLRRHPNEAPPRPMIVVGPARTCQWIDGDPRRPGWSFCGRPSVDGKSYCAAHLRRAYIQPGAPKRPKKEWRDPFMASGRV
ncbi:MAG: hypothetical protein F4Y04_05420 [Chloroflexi bacterium]|nr:hypothetical protein [Chloroflexota bacterium]